MGPKSLRHSSHAQHLHLAAAGQPHTPQEHIMHLLRRRIHAGATAEAIQAIPTLVVGSEGDQHEGRECRCAICLEDYEAGAVLRMLPCRHQYHAACLDKWLACKATCPICQQPCTEH